VTELLSEWIRGLTAACVITAAAGTLTPAGPVKRVLKLISGMVLTAVLLSPLLRPDLEGYTIALANYREQVAVLTQELEETEKRLDRTYIETGCAAYILDEAHALGLEGRVEVSAKWRDNCWVPWEAELWLNGEPAQLPRLSGKITAELGIAAERQYWNENGQ